MSKTKAQIEAEELSRVHVTEDLFDRLDSIMAEFDKAYKDAELAEMPKRFLGAMQRTKGEVMGLAAIVEERLDGWREQHDARVRAERS